MKKATLLGVSEASIAIIFDVLEEEYAVTHFDIHLNIATDVVPSLPFKIIHFVIRPLHEKIHSDEKVFFGVASPNNKRSVFDDFLVSQEINKDRYRTLIHSKSSIARSSIIEKGVLIESHVVVSSQSHIDFGVFIKRGSVVGHHNRIGAFTDINPGVTLSGKVSIGTSCIIGSGTVVKDNITIGDNTIIGIGSVVTKDIPANCVAYGNPCKVIKENSVSRSFLV